MGLWFKLWKRSFKDSLLPVDIASDPYRLGPLSEFWGLKPRDEVLMGLSKLRENNPLSRKPEKD